MALSGLSSLNHLQLGSTFGWETACRIHRSGALAPRPSKGRVWNSRAGLSASHRQMWGTQGKVLEPVLSCGMMGMLSNRKNLIYSPEHLFPPG